MDTLNKKLNKRHALERQHLQRFYEAAAQSYYRPYRGGNTSADRVIDQTRNRIRDHARYLDENYDLVVGVLDDLTTNIVGSGISVEPLARYQNGELATELNQQIAELWQEFWEWPDVTSELSGDELDQLLCRSWLRDGEVFLQHIYGNRTDANYRTRIPYMLEALESDFVPYELNSENIVHGIQKNAWRQPVGYYVYKYHPGDYFGGGREVKFVNAERITHLKFVRRLHQTRGISVLHAVMTRIDDIKDYEESERIAARIAAAFTGYIRRNGEYEAPILDNGEEPEVREFRMEPGFIFDNLQPGEDVGTIKSDRPSTNLEPFRDGQVRGVAAGTGTRFSPIARNYNGSYSAQRQELVEGDRRYDGLFTAYKHQCKLPVWHRFIDILLVSGLVKIASNINKATLYKPECRRPSTPWIDPAKEARAFEIFLKAGLKSRQQIIRDMNGKPIEVTGQIKSDDLYEQIVGQINGSQLLQDVNSPNNSQSTDIMKDETNNDPEDVD